MVKEGVDHRDLGSIEILMQGLAALQQNNTLADVLNAKHALDARIKPLRPLESLPRRVFEDFFRA